MYFWLKIYFKFWSFLRRLMHVWILLRTRLETSNNGNIIDRTYSCLPTIVTILPSVYMTCQWRLDTSTLSWSTTVMRPTQLVAMNNWRVVPMPPSPMARTNNDRSLRCPKTPNPYERSGQSGCAPFSIILTHAPPPSKLKSKTYQLVKIPPQLLWPRWWERHLSYQSLTHPRYTPCPLRPCTWASAPLPPNIALSSPNPVATLWTNNLSPWRGQAVNVANGNGVSYPSSGKLRWGSLRRCRRHPSWQLCIQPDKWTIFMDARSGTGNTINIRIPTSYCCQIIISPPTHLLLSYNIARFSQHTVHVMIIMGSTAAPPLPSYNYRARWCGFYFLVRR